MQYKDDLISPDSPERLYPLIGESIRRFRKQRNMTQKQLAELIGGDQKFISKIEIGKARPGLSTYLRIANAFQVSIDRFLTDTIKLTCEYSGEDMSKRASLEQAEQKLTQNLLDTIFRYLQEKIDGISA